jgi:fatty acid synthase subunit alpha
MQMKGFSQRDCTFTGYSLGEYSVLASIADVLHISALVDVAFYLGITMQSDVERDSENRSNYAMCVVSSSRISPSFSDVALREIVMAIATLATSLQNCQLQR